MANILQIKTKKRKSGMSSKATFQVRDFRERDWFIVDNAFLDGKWLRLLKGAPVAVYFALCRHVGSDQMAFPSIQYLVDETGYQKRWVMNAIKTLESHRLISVDREKRQHNIYSLLNKKHWRKMDIYSAVKKKYILDSVRRDFEPDEL